MKKTEHNNPRDVPIPEIINSKVMNDNSTGDGLSVNRGFV
jgi:hypothetical protein